MDAFPAFSGLPDARGAVFSMPHLVWTILEYLDPGAYAVRPAVGLHDCERVLCRGVATLTLSFGVSRRGCGGNAASC